MVKWPGSHETSLRGGATGGGDVAASVAGGGGGGGRNGGGGEEDAPSAAAAWREETVALEREAGRMRTRHGEPPTIRPPTLTWIKCSPAKVRGPNGSFTRVLPPTSSSGRDTVPSHDDILAPAVLTTRTVKIDVCDGAFFSPRMYSRSARFPDAMRISSAPLVPASGGTAEFGMMVMRREREAASHSSSCFVSDGVAGALRADMLWPSGLPPIFSRPNAPITCRLRSGCASALPTSPRMCTQTCQSSVRSWTWPSEARCC